jgi:hypothetical protein
MFVVVTGITGQIGGGVARVLLAAGRCRSDGGEPASPKLDRPPDHRTSVVFHSVWNLNGYLRELPMFSHDAEVGVKCMLKRGCLVSQACTAGCLCVA